jgi:hypothetical protein
VVATGGNQRQIGSAQKWRKQAKTVAAGCHRLPETFRGKQGVCRGAATRCGRSPPCEGAHIPLELQFTDDYLSSEQHRCFRAGQTVVDVSTTTQGYACAFARAS